MRWLNAQVERATAYVAQLICGYAQNVVISDVVRQNPASARTKHLNPPDVTNVAITVPGKTTEDNLLSD